jgi:hypothetical protein
MADIERIKRDIAELANRKKAVRFEEIERLVNQLANIKGYEIHHRNTKETHLFRASFRDESGTKGPFRFGVCAHNQRSKHVKPCYVTEFLEAMADFGLYGD